MRHTSKLALLGLALAGPIALWIVDSRADAPTGPDAASASQPLAFALPTDVRQVYDLEVRSAITVGGGEAPRSWRHRLGGRLSIQLVPGESSPLRMACRLLDPTQEIDGVACPDPKLATWFAIDIDRTGRFGAFRFPDQTSEETRGQLRGLMNLFQVVTSTADSSSWQEVTTTDHGPCTEIYRRTATGLCRSRLRYDAEGDKQVQVFASAGQFTLSPEGPWIGTAQVHEDIEVRTAQGQSLRAETTGTLHPVLREACAPIRIDDELDRMATAPSPHSPSPTAMPQTTPATAAERRSFLDQLAKLDTVDTPGALLDAIRDALLAHHDLADLLVSELRYGEHSDLTASTAIHALKMAGHPRAQIALTSLAGDPELAQRNRVRAVIDLGGVAASTAESRRWLWTCGETAHDGPTRELATTATLALGRIGNAMRQTSDPDYPVLRDRILTSLAAAHSPRSRSALLTAAGNTGDPTFRQPLADQLRQSDPQLRATAAKALGRIPGSQTDLLRGLTTDPNPRVRSRLAQGLLLQKPVGETPLRLVARSLRTENDESARFAMARVLGGRVDEFDWVAGALDSLLETESSTRIRQYVAGRLAGR